MPTSWSWNFTVAGHAFAGSAADWHEAYTAIQSQAQQVFGQEFAGLWLGDKIRPAEPCTLRR